MSKPKHAKRGRNRWIDYAIIRGDCKSIKGALDYSGYLIKEIEELKLRGPGNHLAKLRKYLKMAA